jgi:hypothetical protein
MAALGASAGIGFIIGPALGGILAKHVHQLLPPAISVCLYCVNMVVMRTFLPETAPLLQTRVEMDKLLVKAAKLFSQQQLEQKVAMETDEKATPQGKSGAGSSIDYDGALLVVKRVVDSMAPGSKMLSNGEKAELLLKAVPFLNQSRSSSEGTSAAQEGAKKREGRFELDDVRSCLLYLYYDVKGRKGLIPTESQPSTSAASMPRSASAFLAQMKDRYALVTVRYPLVGRILQYRALVDASFMMIHATFPIYTQVGRSVASTAYPSTAYPSRVPLVSSHPCNYVTCVLCAGTLWTWPSWDGLGACICRHAVDDH